MMNIQITINVDNAAFDYLEHEVSRVLDQVTSNMEHQLREDFIVGEYVTLRDTNGNTVGKCEITE